MTAVGVLPILKAICRIFAFHHCTQWSFQNSGEIKGYGAVKDALRIMESIFLSKCHV